MGVGVGLGVGGTATAIAAINVAAVLLLLGWKNVGVLLAMLSVMRCSLRKIMTC